ncbi:MAG: serine hydrolase domain-containing protein [Armatimonadota bacterium]
MKQITFIYAALARMLAGCKRKAIPDPTVRTGVPPVPLGLALLLLLTPGADAASLTRKVDRLFTLSAGKDGPGCAVAVVRDGKTVYQRGFGTANLEYGTHIRPDTPFHIASVSKQFTAFAVHLLAAEGKLSLDEDVHKYLPELHDFGKRITVRHLLHHTSGLRDQWDLLSLAGWRYEDVITEDDILSLVWRQRELNFEPGTEQVYSNTGYTLLGLVVKRVSGQSLREFCHERIFRPLRMEHTHFHDDHREVVPGRAYSYFPEPDGGFRHAPLQYANVGATSLFTTAEDLARWSANLDSGKVGGPALVSAMLKKGRLQNGEETPYASGLVHGEHRGLKTVSHDGADAGFRSMFLRFPDERLTVVVLTNLGSFDPVHKAYQVADLYLEGRLTPAPSPPPIPTSSGVEVKPELLDTYTGEFRFPPFLRSFERSGDALMVKEDGHLRRLLPISETKFLVEGTNASFTFIRDPAGGVSEVEFDWGFGSFKGQRFTRRVLTPEELAGYVGDYYSAELNVLYSLKARDGMLVMCHPRGEMPLKPLQGEEFEGDFAVRFTRGRDARVNGFVLDTGRARNLRFMRAVVRPLP